MYIQVRKKSIFWFFLIVPFFKPDCLIGTIGQTWGVWEDAAIICSYIYVFANIFTRKLNRINFTVTSLILFYLMQICATYVNNLSIQYDLKQAIKYIGFLLLVYMLGEKYKICFFVWMYNFFSFVAWINFISILIYWEKGIVTDSYMTPIYFWSSKNHIISLVLAGLVLGTFLNNNGKLIGKIYRGNTVVFILNVFLMGSSTGIVSLVIFGFLVYVSRYLDNENRIFTPMKVFLIGVGIDILIVVFRIQELFAGLIQVVFHKEATLTERTTLWDQALSLVGVNLLWGNGNSYEINQT